MTNNLNRYQRAALQYVDGPLLVLAGAGSGKTSVITQKVAYLVNQCSIPARSIAAVTFTNKAAKEMKARVNKLLAKNKSSGLTISTFHNLGLRIIRSEIKTLGFKKGFSVLDQEDCRNLLKELMVRHSDLDDKLLDTLLSTISNWKNSLLEPNQALKSSSSKGETSLALLYAEYQRSLKAYNAVDFDDLIMIPVLLFRTNPKMLANWRGKIRYLLVDEYQDTNLSQYELIKILVDERQALTVVGDDDQSIYAWRGARPENLFQLQKDFPRLKTVKLEQNYRSTSRILRAANELIDHNTHLIKKELWSDLGFGEPLRFISNENEETECERVVNEIMEMRLQRRCKYNDFAILYRGNYQAKLIEIKLQSQDIPYQITGGQSFYAKTEIKDLMAYLRLLINPDDDNALLRIINTPRRQIGSTTLEKLGDYANNRDLSLFTAIDEVGLTARISADRLDRLKKFKQWIQELSRKIYVGEFIEVIKGMLSDINYLGWLQQNASNEHVANKRWENINILLAQLSQLLITSSEELENSENENVIADAIAKLILRDILDYEDEDAKDDKVQLLTLHAAKGLEFLHVFIVGMEEGILPHRNSIETGSIEEERRLTYVGITRAQRTLTMTAARQRKSFGEVIATSPSRFIEEIPEDDLIRIGENKETCEEENQKKGIESLAALKSMFD